MKIFISYSTKDKETVHKLKRYMPDDISVWIDHKAIQGGNDLTKEIKKGINGSDIYFLFISEHSLASPWVEKEIKWAKKREVNLKYEFIVPVLLEENKALATWSDKKFKDRKYIVYNNDFHEMSHEMKDTMLNKTIEKFNHACLLKSKIVENLLGVVAVILTTFAFFSTPTKQEHINYLQNESRLCTKSNIHFTDMHILGYASCAISESRELLSVGIFGLILDKEQKR